MALLQVKVIKAKKMKIPQVRKELVKAAEKQAKITENKYKETVASWKGAKPKFQSIIEVESDITVLTGPVGSTEAVEKFVFLDEGTKIRWAVMSKNWKSKTKPRQLKSGGGRGKVVIAGRRAMRKRNIKPRRGIEARKWTETLGKQRTRPFTKAMIQATNKGLENIYG
jgi:hypothetical protein